MAGEISGFEYALIAVAILILGWLAYNWYNGKPLLTAPKMPSEPFGENPNSLEKIARAEANRIFSSSATVGRRHGMQSAGSENYNVGKGTNWAGYM